MEPRIVRIGFGLAVIAAGIAGGAWILGLIIGVPVFIWGLRTPKDRW